MGDEGKWKLPSFSTSVRNSSKITVKEFFFLSFKPIKIKRLKKMPTDERYPQNLGRWKADG